MQEGKMPDFNVIKIGCIVVILLVLLIAAVIITVKREKSINYKLTVQHCYYL